MAKECMEGQEEKWLWERSSMQSSFRQRGELVVALGRLERADDARCQMGQPRVFESQLGLNARIEEWNPGLQAERPFPKPTSP